MLLTDPASLILSDRLGPSLKSEHARPARSSRHQRPTEPARSRVDQRPLDRAAKNRWDRLPYGDDGSWSLVPVLIVVALLAVGAWLLSPTHHRPRRRPLSDARRSPSVTPSTKPRRQQRPRNPALRQRPRQQRRRHRRRPELTLASSSPCFSARFGPACVGPLLPTPVRARRDPTPCNPEPRAARTRGKTQASRALFLRACADGRGEGRAASQGRAASDSAPRAASADLRCGGQRAGWPREGRRNESPPAG